MTTPPPGSDPDRPFDPAHPYASDRAAWSEAEQTHQLDPDDPARSHRTQADPYAAADDPMAGDRNPADEDPADRVPADQDAADQDAADRDAADRAAGDTEAQAPPTGAATAPKPGVGARIGSAVRRKPVQLVAALLVGLLLGSGVTALIAGGHHGDRVGITANQDGRGGQNGGGQDGRGPGGGRGGQDGGRGGPDQAPGNLPQNQGPGNQQQDVRPFPAPGPNDAPQNQQDQNDQDQPAPQTGSGTTTSGTTTPSTTTSSRATTSS